MAGAFLTSFRYAPRFEAIGIESRWRPPDVDQPGRSLWLLLGPASWMSQYTLQLVGILDYGDHFHVRSALGTCHRIDLVDLREKSSPCAFARIDVDLFRAF